MRVAYICADPGVPVFGRKGCSVHVQEMIRALRRRGAEIELFATRWGDRPPDDLRDLRVHALPAIVASEPAERERRSLAANRELVRRLDRSEPFDLVYERYSLWSFAGMAWARRRGCASILEVNAPLVEEQAAHRQLSNRRLAEQIAQRTFDAAGVVAAVSTAVADHVAQCTSRPRQIEVVPNGVDTRRFQHESPARNPSLSHRPVTIGFVGSLKPWHGVPTLVDAFAAVHAGWPNTQLIIVGDGPDRAAIERQLTERHVRSASRLYGAVRPEVVPRLLQDIDIAVAPYPSMTGFYFSPLKVLEYMAAGRAIAASRIGSLAEWIDHGVQGLLVRPGDAADLAHAIQILVRDSELRTRLGRAARLAAVLRHSWDAVADRVLHLAAIETRPAARAGV